MRLQKTSEGMQSFLFTQPRGISSAWCWASGREFTLCGVSPVSLSFRICSSRAGVTHLACSVHTTVQRGAPLCRSYERKSLFQWRTHECPICWFFMRYEGMPSTNWHSPSYSSSSHHSFTFHFPL